mgnify:CR=1 FL=1
MLQLAPIVASGKTTQNCLIRVPVPIFLDWTSANECIIFCNLKIHCNHECSPPFHKDLRPRPNKWSQKRNLVPQPKCREEYASHKKDDSTKPYACLPHHPTSPQSYHLQQSETDDMPYEHEHPVPHLPVCHTNRIPA